MKIMSGSANPSPAHNLTLFFVWSVLLIIQFFVLFYYVSSRSEFCVVMSVTISACSVRLYLQLFVGGLMPYLRYLCLLAYSGVQHISGCVAFCFVFLRLVYPMLPVSLDCSFAIALLVFSDVYLTCVGLYIHTYSIVNKCVDHINISTMMTGPVTEYTFLEIAIHCINSLMCGYILENTSIFMTCKAYWNRIWQ